MRTVKPSKAQLALLRELEPEDACIRKSTFRLAELVTNQNDTPTRVHLATRKVIHANGWIKRQMISPTREGYVITPAGRAALKDAQ